MPIYAIRCLHCGAEQDVYRAVKDYDDLPDHCGQKMSRQITAPFIQADIQPYKSMVTGEMITSRSQHRTHLKDHGMVEVGNEKPPEPKPLKPLGDLKKDLHETFAGYGY